LSTEVAEVIGLIPRHAYSVQKLVDVTVNDEKKLLIKIRNPWGNEEWNGDWSFKSPLWTEKLRKQLNYTKNPRDGSFYMPWDDFERYFGSITVCRIVPNAVCSSFRTANLRHKSSYIRMTIRKSG
jgi:calpain-15